MKSQSSLVFALGALLLCSGPVLARAPDHGYSQHDSHGSGHHDKGHSDRGRDHGRYDDDDRYDHDDHGHRRYAGMHDRGRHEGWYKRGGRLPVEYRSRTYVVTDWRRAHLHEPRRGYHWVRSDDGDYLLIAITTGIIVDILSH